MKIVGATLWNKILVNGFSNVNTGVLNLFFLVGQVDGFPNRRHQSFPSQIAGVGQHLLHQDTFLAVGQIRFHATQCFFNGKLFVTAQVIQCEAGGVIDVSLPTTARPKEASESALVVSNVELPIVGQQAINQHARRRAVMAHITNPFTCVGKVAKHTTEILSLGLHKLWRIAADFQNSVTAVQPMQAQACGICYPATSDGGGQSWRT